MSRQGGNGPDGQPDTGPLLDDAEKLGLGYLAQLLGPAGTMDLMGLLHPEGRKHKHKHHYDGYEAGEEEEEGAEEESVGEEGADTESAGPNVDQDADPAAGDSSDADSMGEFVEDVWGGEVPIDAHADEYADAGTIY